MSTSHTIIIVDDSASLRAIVCKYMNELGYFNTIEAIDGKEAIEILSVQKTDLIITGLRMPKVNGIDLLRVSQDHSVFKLIPFIVLTSDTEDEGFKKAMQLGATDFLQKPFTKAELAIKVKLILE